jgi:hypothetical protein
VRALQRGLAAQLVQRVGDGRRVHVTPFTADASEIEDQQELLSQLPKWFGAAAR